MKKILLLFLVASTYLSASGQGGNLDLSFGKKGFVRNDIRSDESLYANGSQKVLLHTDGSFYVVLGMNLQTLITHRFADGALNTSYGENGFSVPVYFRPSDAVMQADGKIIVGGTTQLGTDEDFVLARFNTDGSLDNSFSQDGIQTIDFSYLTNGLTGVTLQTDGKILAAGRSASTIYNTEAYFALVRLNTDGSLDNSFSGDGRVTTRIGRDDAATSVAVDKDGKIIATGYSNTSSVYSMAIVRYLPSGELDHTFSQDGKQTITLGWNTGAAAIDVQDDGKLVIGGATLLNTTRSRFLLTRFNADGELDNSFGSGGMQITEFEADASISDLALQKDGKIVVTGSALLGFVMARYNTNGTLDNSFSEDGILVPGDRGDFSSGSSVEIQPDGKIIMTGSYGNVLMNYAVFRVHPDGSLDSSFDGDGLLSDFKAAARSAYNTSADGKIITAGVTELRRGNLHFLVSRYQKDGKPDETFSEDGMLIFDFGSGPSEAHAIVIQPDGKIILAGSASNRLNKDFALIRLNTDGTLDKSFSYDGILMTDIRGYDDVAYAISLQADGRIVVAGNSNIWGTETDFALVRYNTDGTLDNTFSADGKVTTDFGTSADGATSLLIQPDGKIIAVGKTYRGYADIALARYDSDGSPDSSFDGDGRLTTDVSDYNEHVAAVLEADGRIVVAGGISQFLLLRYNNNGSLDNTFSTDGKQLIAFEGKNARIHSLAIQSNGQYVVGGTAAAGLDADFALARINSDGTLDNTFGDDGKLIFDLGNGEDVINSISVDSTRIYAAGRTAYGAQVGILAAFQIGDRNRPPVASVWLQKYTSPTSVLLAAWGSNDPDGGTISYLWEKIGGPDGPILLYGNSASPVVNGLVNGTYTLQLTVTDEQGLADTAILTFTVPHDNLPPVASTWLQKYLSPTSVLLAAWGSNDPEGGPITYSWQKTGGPGGSVLLYGNSASPVITGLVSGDYSYTLTVTDDRAATGSATLEFTVRIQTFPPDDNLPPFAGAWLQKYLTPSSVLLAAWGSGDPEGLPITYAWEKTAGPDGAAILYGNSASPVITGLVNGTYTYRLTVTDNQGATGSKELTFTVSGVPLSSNRSQSLMPNENANSNNTDQFIVYPNPVKDILNFRWMNEYTGVVILTVMDISGRKIKDVRINKTAQPYSGSIEVTGLKPGQYNLHISNENKTFTKPFMKE
jgi:uncharacterized delta-60 repeat protein